MKYAKLLKFNSKFAKSNVITTISVIIDKIKLTIIFTFNNFRLKKFYEEDYIYYIYYNFKKIIRNCL